MNKIVILIFCLALFSSVSAQSFQIDFEKVRGIRLLESTREDVKRILKDFESEAEEEGGAVYAETFSTKYSSVEIEYTSGECSDEADRQDEWKVPAGKVKSIEISPEETIGFADFKFDFSNFRKEQKLANVVDLYIYHNKSLGLAFEVSDVEIRYIHFFPPPGYFSYLCESEENEDVQFLRDFYSVESYFGKSKLKDRIVIVDYFPVIDELKLSRKEIIVGCKNTENCENCSDGDDRIEVTTEATDFENDPLTYNYTVSAGKIIGTGKTVVWDLTHVPLGDYTITATIDNGCGVCADPKTETVTIRRCDD
jgi:hypothetical protein